ncbi:MAG TPA: crossover junction endodeoxyribonuclease RuvC [Bacteroidota bacterium]|nr:crossover junction endodeoxyribonuclease RuvC [Bacteroidota bacterium]
MIILGVDPGTLITGYGVIEVDGGKLSLLEVDVVKNRSDQSMPVRLKAIYSTLCRIIEKHHPDEFAIETAFYGKNVQSAMKLGHARGVAILAAVNSEIPTAEYSPREVKQAVVGTGAASKEQVSYMIRSILSLKSLGKYYDATDALAVALCHYHKAVRSRGVKNALTGTRTPVKSWKAFVQAHPEKLARPR